MRTGPRLRGIAGALMAALLSLAEVAVSASSVVEYRYDRVGNIVEIKRQAAPDFAVTGFDPPSGAVGTTVTIYGTGFSPSPADNAVGFNGTAAVVSAANSGSISTTVPSGASTGRISVTVGANTAYSTRDFVVTIPGAPTITSFSPGNGVAGSPVAVVGARFDPASGATTVKLNGITATATVSSETSLSFAVPAAASSGRITATTVIGTGMSGSDFIVPPNGINASDIASTGRVHAGGPAFNLAVGSSNTHGLVLFDGTAETYYTVQLGQLAITPSNARIPYQVIKPDNSVLTSGYVSIGSTYAPTIHLPPLPVSGTYSLLLSPGLATLNTNVRVVPDPVMAVDGAALAFSTDTPMQSLRAVVPATSGQQVGLGLAGLAMTQTSGSLSLTAYNPDGSQMAGAAGICWPAGSSNPQGNCDHELDPATTGNHTLIARPPSTATASFSLQVSSLVTGTLAYDTPATVTLGRVGQDARLSFAGTAGDSVGLTISGVTALPQAQSFVTKVRRPEGQEIASASPVPPASGYIELGALASSGNYAVTIDPSYGAHGTARLTLKQGDMLTSTDAATEFGPSYAGEVTRFRFSANAGDNLAIGLAGVYYGSGSGSSSLSVFRPDRSQVSYSAICSPTVNGGRCKLNLLNLPLTGMYSVAVVPPAGVQVSAQAALSSELTGSLAAGTPVAINAARIAQNARYAFAATAGESTAVKLSAASTTPAGLPQSLVVYKPDGTQLSSATVTSGSAMVNIASAPASGTYSAFIEAASGAPWQATLSLDPGGDLTIDGATVALSGGTEERLRYRLSGTAGQRLELGIGGLGHTGSGSGLTSVTCYRPDGTMLLATTCSVSGAGSCELSQQSLPLTGTYSLVLAPPAGVAISAGTLAASTPVTGSFTVGDPAQSVAITRYGQTLRHTFAGTASQLLKLTWAGTSVSGNSSVAVSVLKPDGTTLSSGSFGNGSTSELLIASLPTAGTYTVVLDPSAGATMSASMAVVAR